MSDGEDPPPIADSEEMWRRANPSQVVVAEDGSTRPSSAVFKSEQTDGLSFHRAALTSVEAVLARYPQPFLVAVRAGDIRAAGCDFVYRPLPDDPSHYVTTPRKLPGNAARRLVTQRKAWWRVGPQGPEEPPPWEPASCDQAR